MINTKTIINKIAKGLNINKLTISKVLSETFRQIESEISKDKNFMFKGYAKIVKSKNKKSRITKTELLNLKTKEK
jgi:nucleoid DNA-binding protein